MAFTALMAESCSAIREFSMGLRRGAALKWTKRFALALLSERESFSEKGRRTEADLATRITIRREWESLLSATARIGSSAASQ